MHEDEAIFHSESASLKAWSVDGKIQLVPKTGSGIMISAVVDAVGGFGIPMAVEEVDELNVYRSQTENNTYVCGQYGAPQEICKVLGIPESDKKRPLPESPGVRYLRYGANKEGYWKWFWMMHQLEDMIDYYRYFHPCCRIIFETDHSGVHLIAKVGGLDVMKMNRYHGGVAVARRDTVITEHCLGPFAATRVVNGVTIDQKLKVGDTQVRQEQNNTLINKK